MSYARSPFSTAGTALPLLSVTYTLYRMPQAFGDFDSALTRAVNRIAAGNSECVYFSEHAFLRQEAKEIDHGDVWICLRRGKVFGPEHEKGELRANVVHQGVHVRVAIGGLDHAAGDWNSLRSFVVCTVMKA